MQFTLLIIYIAGTSVAVITAEDADDPNEGGNAKIGYSLLKNVIDDAAGLFIFSVNRSTGLVETRLCCLDREHTTSYDLLLAATDGGGLQGNSYWEIFITFRKAWIDQLSRLDIRSEATKNGSLT